MSPDPKLKTQSWLGADTEMGAIVAIFMCLIVPGAVLTGLGGPRESQSLSQARGGVPVLCGMGLRHSQWSTSPKQGT